MLSRLLSWHRKAFGVSIVTRQTSISRCAVRLLQSGAAVPRATLPCQSVLCSLLPKVENDRWSLLELCRGCRKRQSSPSMGLVANERLASMPWLIALVAGMLCSQAGDFAVSAAAERQCTRTNGFRGTTTWHHSCRRDAKRCYPQQ